MRERLLALVAVMLGTSCLTVGCASQPSRFYLLSALPSTEMATPVASGQPGLTIGVGPVVLPRYLDRPQIATRTSAYELKLAEFERWAEPLDTNFTRVMAENLAVLIPSARVSPFPWPRVTPIDYQILVEVTHFLSQMGGESLLIADWFLLRGEGPQVVATGKSRVSVPSSGQDYTSMVAALSQAVAELSREIATATRGLGPRTSKR
jgi:uncharacterized lipoprotein YmbA